MHGAGEDDVFDARTGRHELTINSDFRAITDMIEGADAIMIGRAAQGTPELAQLAHEQRDLLLEVPELVGMENVVLLPHLGSATNETRIAMARLTLASVADLQYARWVDDRREIVNKASNGEIGYLHIRAMDAPSLRQFQLDLAANRTKKALVIDQRFNGGGGIDQELLEILEQAAAPALRPEAMARHAAARRRPPPGGRPAPRP